MPCSPAERRTITYEKHKDTLFRMLFSSRENLLSLYNAVNGTHYTDPTALKVVTLENAVYMNMKNDQAFLLDFHLNLYEHQSTWNPNMPLRFLLYVAKEYQMLIRNQTIYSSALVSLPTPHFIVFTMGGTQGSRKYLKLSNAFQHHGSSRTGAACPDSKYQPEQKSRNFRCLPNFKRIYASGRTNSALYKNMPLNEAVETAVNECIEENILADFLQKQIGGDCYVFI